MRQTSLVDEVAHALHLDPSVRSRVGERVRTDRFVAELPDIVVTGVTDPQKHGVAKIVLTCRAKTSSEADKVGAAVKTALKSRILVAHGGRWVTVQDRSGYDSSAKAFRRVILVEPKD
jgi:hypothetical protein